jgi:N-dimethylarginine dimethylaminohydrolase
MTIVALAPRKAPAIVLDAPTYLVVDPAYFNVSYAINPWMKPGVWAEDPEGFKHAARRSFAALTRALKGAGGDIEAMPGYPGAPDLVFPANAAVVFNRKAVLARFLHPERQVEEAINRLAFESFRLRGLIDEVVELPDPCRHEGAGDFIWDAKRNLFWAGFGQRTNLAGTLAMATEFGMPVIRLELATDRFYHLDTCFCPLSGGEILYYPPAFTEESLNILRNSIAAEDLIEATDEDAARFCVNAVCIDQTIVMAKAADDLRHRLTNRGYKLEEVDLDPFILSGGAAYCMTLRLDRAGV